MSSTDWDIEVPVDYSHQYNSVFAVIQSKTKSSAGTTNKAENRSNI